MRFRTPCFAAIFACSMALPLWGQGSPLVQGEVTKAGLTSGTIAITHGPIPALGMSFAQDGPVVQGQVMKVDLTSGTITIAHGPIPALGLPSERTDDFEVKDAIMLNAIRPGEKLTFTAGRMAEKLVITAIVTPKP